MTTHPLSLRLVAPVCRGLPLRYVLSTARDYWLPLGVQLIPARQTSHPIAVRIAGTTRRGLPLAHRAMGAPPRMHPLAYRCGLRVVHLHPLAVRWRESARLALIGLVVDAALLEQLPVELQVDRGQQITFDSDDQISLAPLPE